MTLHGVTPRQSSSRRWPSFQSPVAVYRSVASHVVALVTHRQRTPSLSYDKRHRFASDATTVTLESSIREEDEDFLRIDSWSDLLTPFTRRIRAQQSMCRHCQRLFFDDFVLESAFCSLDCRTCFQYEHTGSPMPGTSLSVFDEDEDDNSLPEIP